MKKRFFWLVLIILCILGYAYWKQMKDIQPLSSRWTKLDATGVPMHAWAGPWFCVKDENTGRVWEVKRDDESIHDGYWTYSWWQAGKGEQNQGDCYFETERCDTADLIRRTNALKLCGRSDWRLPTSTELQSIVETPHQPGNPSVNMFFFPQTKHGDYWTSEDEQELSGVYRHLKTGATAINFTKGEAVIIPYRNAAFTRLISSSDKKN